MEITWTVSVADIAQLVIIIGALLTFYNRMVKALSCVEKHEKLLYEANSEVAVVTHTACLRIRKNCKHNKEVPK